MTALEFANEIAQMMQWEEISTIEGTLEKEADEIVQACDRVLKSLQGDKLWQELEVDAHLQLTATRTEEDITVTATYGSSELLCTGLTFLTSDVGKLIHVAGAKIAYRIASTDSVTATLDRPWAEDSISEEELTVYIGQDTYDLPTDYDRMTLDKFISPVTDSEIEVVNPRELSNTRKALGSGMPRGKPVQCSIGGLNTAGTAKKVYFDTTSEGNYELSYKYQKKHPSFSTDATEILYPEKNYLYIMDLVKARLDRDSEASQVAGQVANDALVERTRQDQNIESGSSPIRITAYSTRYGRARRGSRG